MEIGNHWQENAGAYGWAILAAYVIAFDILAPETLSSAADRALNHDYMKWVAWGVGGVVAGHVFNLFPEQYDPIQRGAEFVSRKIGL